MRYYINTTTGEIVQKKTYLQALRYFRADGKKVGYKVRFYNVRKYDPQTHRI